MYPKVKVREQEEYDDQYDFETRSLQSLRIPESFSLNDFSSPENSPTSVARVRPLDSSSAGASNDRSLKGVDENRTNVRANPVLRPRAVLSSPDNDLIIGSKNKKREGLLSSLKKRSPCQNRHVQCKIIPSSIAADGSVSTRRALKEEANSNADPKTRQRTAPVADPTLRVNLQKSSQKSDQNTALRNSRMNNQ